jgi:adenylate cyclase
MSDERVERRLAAILAGDVVGYSRLMGADEVGTLRALKAIRRELTDPSVAAHHGRVVKTTGDGILIEFPSVVDAVKCAVQIQHRMSSRTHQVPEDKRIVFRIGINVGDVIVEDGDVFGDGVNVAARLEALCDPGGVYVSHMAHDQIRDKLPLAFADLGEHTVKNIARAVRVYGLSASEIAKLPEPTQGDDRPPLASASVHSKETMPALPLRDKPSIAVLPFQNMSGDPEQEYFADGLSEDIITALSRMHSLFVIARNSTFTYKGRAVDVKQVGRDLAARYILEGSVRKIGNRIRVTGQLIDAETGRHIWAERYDRELVDIFDIQDEITRAVAASVQTQVVLFDGEVVSRERMNVWGLLKRAWSRIYSLNFTSLDEARQLAEEALRLDPDNAHAHAILSVALHHLGMVRGGPTAHDEVSRARDLALTAIKLNEGDEYSHWALGNACNWLGDTDRAIAEFRRALELNPNYSLAYGMLGTALAVAGRPEESIAASEIAIRSNPRDPSNFFRYTALAAAYFMLGNYETAIEWARKSVEQKRDWFRAHQWLIASLAHSGRLEEAQSAVSAYLEIFPKGSLRDVDRYPLKSTVHKESLLLGLRKAGLRE